MDVSELKDFARKTIFETTARFSRLDEEWLQNKFEFIC